MRIRVSVLFVVFCSVMLVSCRSHDKAAADAVVNSSRLSDWNKKLTRVIITDVFTPPVCSRIYAYANIAAYETLVSSDSSFSSYSGRLNELDPVPDPGDARSIDYRIASVIAFTTVSQKLVFDSESMKELEDEYIAQIADSDVSEDKLNSSLSYGRLVGEHILQWASSDGYLQRNSYAGYMVTKDLGRWKPTPPDYMDAVEPNWGRLRPFTLDSASQYRPPAPAVFDSSKRSKLYLEAMQVYEVTSKLSKDDTEIARYWDCNPNVSVTSGHVMYFQQQISPGGHWIHIAGSIADKEKMSDVATAALMSKVAIAIADGFISCWEAKFNYSSLRPETFINIYIDKEWRPLIQTPPFPEYPSGHSVISASAATILSHIAGENYSFTDSAEVEFGRQARKFNSFTEAAREASISRLYGGIHFLSALDIGQVEGQNVATHVIARLSDEGEKALTRIKIGSSK
jgi:hypothetical protein